MSRETITFYAKKFFPHLVLSHAEECVQAIFEAYQKQQNK